MITGMLRPDSGSIRFDGHVWCRQDLNQIGALIETPPLYDNLTAEENLKVRTTMFGLPEFWIKEVLRTVDLTDTGKKRAGQFSLGIQELRELIRSFPTQGITVILENVTASSETESGLTVQENIRTRGGAKVTVKIHMA